MKAVIDFLLSLATALRIEAFGAQVLELEDRPEVDGQKAWEAYQAAFDERVAKARRSHGRVREIEAERRCWVHSALKGSVPSRGVAA